MPIVLVPNSPDQSHPDYYKYPPENKVLSGTFYGFENRYQGKLHPEDYVPDYERLKKAAADKSDIKQG